MSIIEEIRIALLDLFPDLAAADKEARNTEQIDGVRETAHAEMESMEPQAGSEGGSPVIEPEAEEEGPRKNGVLLTDHSKRGADIDVLCDPDQVVKAATIMDEAGFFLEAITGVDWIKEDKLEIIYDYNQYGQEQCRVAIRTFISRSEPEVATISDVMPSANWHERETHDFYGIKFKGHPDLTPILLPEDADFHPLLKDFKP